MFPKLMKFYFLVLLYFSHFNLFAQNYTHFPDSNAYWSQGQTYNDGTQIIEDIYTIFIDGDTIVNGISYHKLYASGIENTFTPFWIFVNSITFNHETSGLFREDSLKHIYTYNFGVDDLLYDFNLQLNDTLDYLAYQFILVQGTYVSSIDSVLVGSNYRKSYHLTAPNIANDYITLTEGIGSSFGLLNFSGPQIEQIKTLFCFRSDDGDYILDSLNCSYVGIGENEINNSITIFPNPSTGQINLKISDDLNSDFIINIYNQLSKEVFSTIVKVYNDKVLQLPIILPKGLYFILVQNKTQMKYIKYIVN